MAAMKRLFGNNKSKPPKTGLPGADPPLEHDPTPIYSSQTRQGFHRNVHDPSSRPSVDEHAESPAEWEVVGQPSPMAHPAALTPSRSSSANSPPAPQASFPPLPTPGYPHVPTSPASADGHPVPPRSSSPHSTISIPTHPDDRHRRRDDGLRQQEDVARRTDDDAIRKQALNGRRTAGLLAALEPQSVPPSVRGPSSITEFEHSSSHHGGGGGSAHHGAGYDPLASEVHSIETGREKEKKRFWERGRDDKERRKEAEREREREKFLQKEKEKALQKERERERERQKERDRERELRERRRDADRQEKSVMSQAEEHPADLTRMIGWLTATASEDWSIVLEVCDRASASSDNAREAVRALRKEFKYAEPPAQLSAARLLAIMLRNCSPVFLFQCSSRKFLDALEDVVTSSRTSPVVRERMMEVLAGAAYLCTIESRDKTKVETSPFWSDKDDFRSLWRRVRPADKPEHGIPFDTNDYMFNPPVQPVQRRSSFHHHPVSAPPTPPPGQHLEPRRLDSNHSARPGKLHKQGSQGRVIPPDEDIRRLFQECKVGRGNATLLSESLAFAKPEDIREKPIMREFYHKCRASQEFIFAQIPWATATAEQSRHAEERPTFLESNQRSYSEVTTQTALVTREEELLAELLAVNEELQCALRAYQDLLRLAEEREAEERSRREYRMNRTQLRYAEVNGFGLLPLPPAANIRKGLVRSSSPSPVTSPALPAVVPSAAHPLPPVPTAGRPNGHGMSPKVPAAVPQSMLAPIQGPRHGPRSPAHRSTRSRSPSRERPSVDSPSHSRASSSGSVHGDLPNGLERLNIANQRWRDVDDEDKGIEAPVQLSEKALGKRKMEPPPTPDQATPPEDIYADGEEDDSSQSGPDLDAHRDGGWHHHRPPVQYIYDAQAERTADLLRQGKALTPNVR